MSLQKDYRFDQSSDQGVFRSLRVMALPLLDPGGKSVLGAIQVTRGWAVGLEPDEVTQGAWGGEGSEGHVCTLTRWVSRVLLCRRLSGSLTSAEYASHSQCARAALCPHLPWTAAGVA
jgi:hypothetical protein